MIDDILAALPLGFLLSFMPGAVFFVLLETSVVKGFKAAIAFDLGVILADIIFISIAYFSSYRLIQSIKDEPALFIFGGLILVTYGLISFIKQKRIARELTDSEAQELVKTNYFGLFFKGFFLNFINIGVLGFWLTIIITVGPQLDMDRNRMITFFTSVLIGYFVTDIFKILLAKQLRNRLTSGNILKIKKIISIILIVFGILLLAQAWFPQIKNSL
ncbi:LysE family transporter [Flavobacterium salilacus subsp. salilacus]|uniref:LysE family translocator n=1 Tax=Flavobacterium TaxID=237 RepID=UPI0010754A40|nr:MULTISPECIES: LysE family transporter [Flavobacterium]KAF2519011.1 LysE family transporter [Flavobacterium salilacus subsp. salilacus]MBE1614826.1 LysE family transporter [Flavobacterium sp. SaA2.13]